MSETKDSRAADRLRRQVDRAAAQGDVAALVGLRKRLCAACGMSGQPVCLASRRSSCR